jgi:prepilin-type N-terminal cleavage/methylation domain-containing protein
MTRRGFTLIELVMTMAIVTILASLALPTGREMRRRAIATSVIGDFRVIRNAAYSYASESGVYPKSGNWGQVPTQLVSALPDGFEFQNGGATYRWRRWSLPNGMPKNASQTVLLGLQIRSSDKRLITAIKNLYDGPQAYGKKGQVTLVIE